MSCGVVIAVSGKFLHVSSYIPRLIFNDHRSIVGTPLRSIY